MTGNQRGSIPQSAEDDVAEKVSPAESNDYDSAGFSPVSHASARIFTPTPTPQSALAHPLNDDYSEQAGTMFMACHLNMPATSAETMFGDGFSDTSPSPPPFHNIITVTAEMP